MKGKKKEYGPISVGEKEERIIKEEGDDSMGTTASLMIVEREAARTAG